MSLQSGSRLGPYEIVSPIGAGGMGEVWRARDTRLERDVAVKVLPAAMATDPQFRARFEREAKTISQLNHPNICQVYDVGQSGDGESAVSYLVMELLDGESLAERIARGALPVPDVIRLGAQIGDALAAAHRSGIIHRDLKPANVMLTRSGAKLLDFGLAKLAQPLSSHPNDSLAATAVMTPLTAQGTIVGTLPYMSPEQLHGQSLDHRTDIFSLGVILYEMTTGRRPFQGSSSLELFTAILSSEPAPLQLVVPSAPPALGQIIATSLEKDQERRWQTAHDVARQLRWISESSPSVERVAVSSRQRFPFVAALVLAAGIAGLLTFAFMRYFLHSTEKSATLRVHLAPPAGMLIPQLVDSSTFAISPDGRTLCFIGVTKEPAHLFLRRLDSTEVRKLEGSSGAGSPFWSSDGEWIGFSARGKLWKTRISGGAPEAICALEAGSVSAASWTGTTILFAKGAVAPSGIFRVVTGRRAGQGDQSAERRMEARLA
ncbi:MAG TPA: protein kinase [Thermoanaerobaculia bacterium]|nr:protein kinase [Thermoanaerobaculia bacterium]